MYCFVLMCILCTFNYRSVTQHKGGDIGHVVSAWKNNGRMDLVLEINNHTLEGAFGKQFVEKGVCKDLSLGYKVEMSKALDGSLRASNKRVMEVSLVREGARPNCQIHQFAPSHRIIV